MPSAFMMLSCHIGKEHSVRDALHKIPGVIEAEFVYGGYDIAVQLAADTTAEIKQGLIREIKRIEGITSSIALIKKEQDAHASA